jgi:predicted DsbA family dithiol-disulfide isomerase
MKKLSGETKLLLIMGLIVLAGGGFLAFNPAGNPMAPPGPGGKPPGDEPTPKPMDVAGFNKLWESSRHRKGPKDGSKPDIAVIEFADVECGSCRYAYRKITKNFGEVTPVEFAFRHFPLENHRFAQPCSQALEAADKQGKFWELYTALFEEEAPELSLEYIEERAKKVGLDMERFRKEGQNPDVVKIVDDDMNLGKDLVVMRTPTFYIFDRKKNAVTIAVGPKEAMDALKGLPGVPTPEPAQK